MKMLIYEQEAGETMRTEEGLARSIKEGEIVPENRNDEAENNGDGLLTAEEVANLLKIHTQSVYQMKARKEIPYRTMRKRGIRFLRQEIQSWLETGELPQSFIKRELT